jgi:hypothetical protein
MTNKKQLWTAVAALSLLLSTQVRAELVFVGQDSDHSTSAGADTQPAGADSQPEATPAPAQAGAAAAPAQKVMTSSNSKYTVTTPVVPSGAPAPQAQAAPAPVVQDPPVAQKQPVVQQQTPTQDPVWSQGPTSSQAQAQTDDPDLDTAMEAIVLRMHERLKGESQARTPSSQGGGQTTE